jgi:DNA-binding NarL/FixJ family response regulator
MDFPLRLILADDHEMFRQGLKSLLLRQRGLRIVGEVETVSALQQQVAAIPSDILLLDLQLDRWVLDEIAELANLTRVLILTANENVGTALTAMRLGARAIVHKRFAVQTLMTAIRTVAEGLVWMPPNLQSEIVGQQQVVPPGSLTKRELEIVRHVASGLRNVEVARRLAISENTVKTHLNNIFQKLELRDRVELALYAVRNGLVAGTSFNH